MSLFQCQNCGCVENTALTSGYMVFMHKHLDFSGIEEREGKRLCSACTPSVFSDGSEVGDGGKWHGIFERVFLPMNMFITNAQGNLAHCDTGETDYKKYQIRSEQ